MRCNSGLTVLCVSNRLISKGTKQSWILLIILHYCITKIVIIVLDLNFNFRGRNIWKLRADVHGKRPARPSNYFEESLQVWLLLYGMYWRLANDVGHVKWNDVGQWRRKNDKILQDPMHKMQRNYSPERSLSKIIKTNHWFYKISVFLKVQKSAWTHPESLVLSVVLRLFSVVTYPCKTWSQLRSRLLKLCFAEIGKLESERRRS